MLADAADDGPASNQQWVNVSCVAAERGGIHGLETEPQAAQMSGVCSVAYDTVHFQETSKLRYCHDCAETT